MTSPVDPLAYPLRCLRRAAENGYSWSLPPDEALAVVAEVERLRALEADAERAQVKADLWSYYEAFVEANGAGSITELVVQRDEAATMRAWAEEAARADLVRVLRRVLDENKLREAHGEDTLGVLMKCGAFHDTEVAALAARIDAVEL